MKKIKDNRGFFVIETMVVIAIVAIVITYVFTNFSNTYNRFIVSESYNNLNVTNAVLNVKKYLENIKIDYENSISDSNFIEISAISRVNTEYYKKLRENLNIKKVFLINTTDFFADYNNLTGFDVKLKRYLDTLSKVKSKFILVAELNDSSYGYMSIYNYNLELIGDASKEYVVYVKKGTNFQDPGYIAEDRNGKKLDALIEGFVDINTSATYYLNYNLNDISLKRKVVVYDDVYDYDYTGNYQVFTAPISGTYKVELWGAQGGGTDYSTKGVSPGGKGAYTVGTIYLNEKETIYIYVGGGGPNVTIDNVGNETTYFSNYNGGGAGTFDTNESPNSGEHGFPGGGATDIRVLSGLWDNDNSLKSRIMVAAGGGGGGWSGNGSSDQYYANGGGHGGALSGIAPPGASNSTVGTQTTGFAFGTGGLGRFGVPPNNNGTGGGGGGYYGGDSGLVFSKPNASGSGGSSFISGFPGVNAIKDDGTPSNQTKHFSGYVFKNMDMKSGNQTFPSPSGTNETGHTGNGYARITLLNPSLKNTLSNVRYIYNETNGSTANLYNHWVELQAYDLNGNNISSGLISIIKSNNSNDDIELLTDGDINTSAYLSSGISNGYIILDLGQEYDLSSIRLWHYYGDGRTYYDNKVKVAGSDEQYRTVMDEEYVETSYGKVIRPESLN